MCQALAKDAKEREIPRSVLRRDCCHPLRAHTPYFLSENWPFEKGWSAPLWHFGGISISMVEGQESWPGQLWVSGKNGVTICRKRLTLKGLEGCWALPL